MTKLSEMIGLARGETVWDLGNATLYDLCRTHPKHTDAREIVAKVWLVGRTYAAAIERRKNANGKINDDFYEVDLVEAMIESNIDSQLERATSAGSPVSEEAFEAHSYLTGVFRSLTGMNKRSLAAKYLHFHSPTCFYILDSRVNSAIGGLLREIGVARTNTPTYASQYDRDYVAFCHKCNSAIERIAELCGEKLTPRELDNLLVYRANELSRQADKG